MAKTKGKGLKLMPEAESYVPSIYLDMDDPEDIAGLEIGQKVVVQVTGTIERISLEKDRSCLTLSPFECEVESKGAYEKLSEDD